MVLLTMLTELPALAQETSDYPQVTLTGKDSQQRAFTLTVFLPDVEKGRYRGTRFAHVPIIGFVRWAGHSFFGEWTPNRGNPTAHDSNALGTVEEFDIDGPESFATTGNRPGAGEAFLKVGVGLLVKPADGQPYRFFNNYTFARRPEISLKTGKDFVEVTQTLKPDEGPHGYRYVHRISLLPKDAGFLVTRSLTNLSKAPLKTEHYCHNFFNVDDTPIGPDYRLTLAFPVTSEDTENAKNAGLTIEKNVLGFAKPIDPARPAFARLAGFPDKTEKYAAFDIQHMAKGVGIRVTPRKGTPPLHRFNLYAAAGAVCPEPFLQLSLAPGETRNWETVYQFYEK